MNLYFINSNLTLYLRIYCSQIFCIILNYLQFFLIFFPYINRLTSSTNPVDIIFCAGDWYASSKLTLKNRNRIGDKTDPWGMPHRTFFACDFYSLNLIVVIRSDKKNFTHFISHLDIFFIRRFSKSRSWNILSKAPVISRLNIDTICLFFARASYTACIYCII